MIAFTPVSPTWPRVQKRVNAAGDISRCKERRVRQAGPPPLPFALTVGVTGHRLEAIPAAMRADVEARIAEALGADRSRGHGTVPARAGAVRAGSAGFTLVSPLAEGADQMAAEAALARGWQLQAMLPFDRETYVADFNDEDSRARFHRLVEAASCTLELPGDPHDPLEAYVMAGRGTVAHCDILIAVWDGLPPRGRGGTGEIVELAIQRGTAIIHLPIEPGDGRILWSAFDPNVLTRTGHDVNVHRPFDAEHLAIAADRDARPAAGDPRAAILRAVQGRAAAPGPRPARISDAAGADRQRRALKTHHWREAKSARRSTRNGVITWPAAATAMASRRRWTCCRKPMAGPTAWRPITPRPSAAATSSTSCSPPPPSSSACRPSHCRPRSSHLAIAEMLITLAIIINTAVGIRHEWHRRWLDYRQLAERLRPMRSLKLLGIAAPDPPGSLANPIARRWIDWYAASVWRALGCPHGRIRPGECAPS